MAVIKPFTALLLAAALAGCSAAAAPCKVSGSVISVVPVIGGVVGGALETCGDVID
jgi:hypothetical protein